MESRYVQIPDVIAVHLGGKDTDAPNITISFVEYIKGCASCLICPMWPENAQRANIYAITTFALHRFCNKWYRAQGYNFDITSSEEDDLPFNGKGCLYFNTSYLVWDMFNNYLTRQGCGDPIPTRICRNGQAAAGSGVLCQLGAVAMAKEGSTVYDILRKYYGEDIAMVHNAPQEGGKERFLGTPLMPGASGDDICTIKRQLNRIGRNYPAIMPLPEDGPEFDVPCERAVRTFQYIFDLPVTGVLDKPTWYKIKQTWANIVQHDTDLFEQEAVAAVKPVSGSAITSNMVQGIPAIDSDGRAAAFQEGFTSRSSMIVVPGQLIPGVTLPNVIISGDTTMNPVISDTGIAEKAALARRSPGNTALGNLSQWNAMRGDIIQSQPPPGSGVPGSIVSDRGIAARAETASAIPGETAARDTVQGAMPEGAVPSNIPPGSVAPGSIISDRGIAVRAETETVIPGVTQESFERSKTAQGEVVQQSALRQSLPPKSNVPESPIAAPKSPTDHLVKIGPSVSTALPDEGGIDSGHAVDWLKKYYGL